MPTVDGYNLRPLLSSKVYLKNGEVIKENDTITDPVLAQTMRKIANDPHAFYNGSLAADIIQDLMEEGTSR